MNKGPLIVNSLPCHVPFVAENVRDADRDELWAAACLTPEQALSKSMECSTLAWTGLYDNVPVCMFGVSEGSALAGVGIPWMIGTKLVDKYATQFLRRNKGKVQEMLNVYPLLMNYVDVRNTRAIRWLRWLGFEIGASIPFGPYNMPFRPFTRSA